MGGQWCYPFSSILKALTACFLGLLPKAFTLCSEDGWKGKTALPLGTLWLPQQGYIRCPDSGVNRRSWRTHGVLLLPSLCSPCILPLHQQCCQRWNRMVRLAGFCVVGKTGTSLPAAVCSCLGQKACITRFLHQPSPPPLLPAIWSSSGLGVECLPDMLSAPGKPLRWGVILLLPPIVSVTAAFPHIATTFPLSHYHCCHPLISCSCLASSLWCCQSLLLRITASFFIKVVMWLWSVRFWLAPPPPSFVACKEPHLLFTLWIVWKPRGFPLGFYKNPVFPFLAPLWVLFDPRSW